MVLLGIDTGGTFTDFVLLGTKGIAVHKVPSTPGNPARAVLTGMKELIDQAGMIRVTYGATVATNALLERNGAKGGVADDPRV